MKNESKVLEGQKSSDDVIELVTGIIAMLEQDSMFASYIAAMGGVDFADVRLRGTNDPYRDIDWPRTIVTGKTHVRLREQEHSIPICIAVDVSTSMCMSGAYAKRDQARDMVEIIAQAALHRNCEIQCILFSDRIEYTSGSMRSMRQIALIINEMQFFTAHRHITTDISCLLDYLFLRFKVPTMAFIISDFLCSFDWVRDFESLLDRNELIALLVEDPRDHRGPPGFSYCRGIESGIIQASFGSSNQGFKGIISFFEELERHGRTVWAQFSTSDGREQLYRGLRNMFHIYEEQLSSRRCVRR